MTMSPALPANSLHMMEFKVPEFVNYGQRVTLQVDQDKKSTKIQKLDLNFTFLIIHKKRQSLKSYFYLLI